MRPEKTQLVNDIKALLDVTPGFFMVSYKGIAAEDFRGFRDKLAEVDGVCHVVPNRLFLKACEGLGLDDICSKPLAGDSALVAGTGDVVALAKAVKDFAKSNKFIEVKFGAVDGKYCSPEEVKQLADLPSREVLLSTLLGTLQAPASQLVSLLNNVSTGLVNVINAYLKDKEKAA